MPLCTRPHKMRKGDPVILIQKRTWGWFTILYVTLGYYHPYRVGRVWIPAVSPQWQLSFNTQGQLCMADLIGTEEMPVNEDVMLVPVGIIDIGDRYHVRKYLKQVLRKMWALQCDGGGGYVW